MPLSINTIQWRYCTFFRHIIKIRKQLYISLSKSVSVFKNNNLEETDAGINTYDVLASN